MPQCYIPYNGTGIYCKTIRMNSTKYELTSTLSESGKNFWKLLIETGLLQYFSSVLYE